MLIELDEDDAGTEDKEDKRSNNKIIVSVKSSLTTLIKSNSLAIFEGFNLNLFKFIMYITLKHYYYSALFAR